MNKATSQELERLRALAKLEVLDSEREPLFDGITKFAADNFAVSIAVISLVDADRQWFKACVGLNVDGTPRDVAFCHYTIQSDRVLVVPDATQDARFSQNPLVTGDPHIRFYAGAPLITDEGHRLGTLCLIDPRPRADFDAPKQQALASMAAAVMQALQLRSEAIASKRLARLASDRDKLLSLAEQMAGVGTWSWDVATNQTKWSSEVYRIHNLDPELPPPDLEGILRLYAPDDAVTLRRMVDRAVAHGLDYDLQATVIRPDGERRDVLARGTVRKGPTGQVEALMGTFQDVTHLRLADGALRASEIRLRRLTDNANDIVTEATLDGRFTFLSAACARITGFEPSDAVGRPAEDFIHPEDRARVLAEIPVALHSDGFKTVEYRHIRKDGRVIWIEARPTLARDPVTGRAFAITDVLRDITERKLAERIVADREARFRQLTDNATDIIAQYTLDGQFTYLSPSTYPALGYRPEEVVGRHVSDFIVRDDLHRVLRTLSKYIDEGPKADSIYFEYRALAKDGSEVWLEAHPMKLFDPDSGDLIGFQDVVRDITKRKALETELQQARDAAVAATELKSAFLANMSHEIRTPLTAILGFTDLLSQTGGLSFENQKYVRRIATAGEALFALVNDVLDFSKIEAGEVHINAESVSPSDLIEGTVALFEDQAAHKSVEVGTRLDGSLPPALSLDKHKVRQILINLVGNAIKFTETGSVRVLANFDPLDETLSVEVTDTGTGLTTEQAQKLFQRFSQVDVSSTRRHGGTGLGLAICKGLVEAMGGEIGVRSQVGAGSTFWFKIHASQVDAAATARPSPTEGFSLEGLRVLIVDDNQAVREITRAILEGAGAEVTDQEDPERSLHVIRSSAFDIMLFDQRMPGMSGEELLALAQARPGPNQSVPAILFSANEHDKSATQKAGFAGQLVKPVSPASLVHAIIAALSPQPADNQLTA